MRLVAAGSLAALGFYVVTFSLAQVAALLDPERAHQLAPYDGRITAQLAASLAGPAATAADRARADAFARQALRQDVTAVSAASTLGINAQTRGDSAVARALFGYAQRLSRRDLTTQLWSIEDAVGRGDVAGALHLYDIALRTNAGLADLLFPVLASAAADPAIRAALVRTLAAGSPWGERYVSYVAASGIDPRSTAALLLGLRQAGRAVPGEATANTINALLSSGSYDDAWRFYTALRKGADRHRSRDPRFMGVSNPSQLDWVIVHEGGADATLDAGALNFSAPAAMSGALVRQVQLLPPGRYRLFGESEALDVTGGLSPYWALTCGGGRELGRVLLSHANGAAGAFSGSFEVPDACPVQTLVLIARPSDSTSGLSGRIDRVELAPAR